MQNLDDKIQTIAQHLKEADRLIALKQYQRALEQIVLLDGVISNNEERVLELMRERKGITMEQHKDGEAKILEAKRFPLTQETILVVDDEKTILLTYAAILHVTDTQCSPLRLSKML